MKIGVFDSGVGGLSVANAIMAAFPQHDVIFMNDSKHVPYGTRSTDEILQFVLPILQSLVQDGCQAIVIACNTVSTTLIEQLRHDLDVPLIGVEPLIKLAAEMTESGVVAVCATPRTLSSERYKVLKETYAEDIKVIEPDCSDWSLLIEQQEMKQHHILDDLEPALQAGADVVVLGCTHYHWIEEEIERLVNGRAAIIQPEPFVIEELTQVLAQLQ